MVCPDVEGDGTEEGRLWVGLLDSMWWDLSCAGVNVCCLGKEKNPKAIQRSFELPTLFQRMGSLPEALGTGA